MITKKEKKWVKLSNRKLHKTALCKAKKSSLISWIFFAKLKKKDCAKYHTRKVLEYPGSSTVYAEFR